jgi:hypothetical protein
MGIVDIPHLPLMTEKVLLVPNSEQAAAPQKSS